MSSQNYVIGVGEDSNQKEVWNELFNGSDIFENLKMWKFFPEKKKITHAGTHKLCLNACQNFFLFQNQTSV